MGLHLMLCGMCRYRPAFALVLDAVSLARGAGNVAAGWRGVQCATRGAPGLDAHVPWQCVLLRNATARVVARTPAPFCITF